jgi:hypothetical protein
MQPAGAVFPRHDVQPKHLTSPAHVDADSYEAGHVHDPPALAALEHQRVEPQVADLVVHVGDRGEALLAHEHHEASPGEREVGEHTAALGAPLGRHGDAGEAAAVSPAPPLVWACSDLSARNPNEMYG